MVAEFDRLWILDIDNYVLVRSDRATGRGGSVALHIDESLQFSPIGLGVLPIDTLTDIVTVSLYLAHGRRVVVVCVYCPPGAPLSDLHFIESYLFCEACITDAIVCLGDFNVDILGQIDYNAKLNIASLFSLRQLIDTPTRLTCNSATILDFIFVSSSINVIECEVSNAISVSDHLTVYGTLAILQHRPGRVSVS